MRAEAILSKEWFEFLYWLWRRRDSTVVFRPIDNTYFVIGLSECEINTSSSLWLLAFTNKPTFLCMLTTRTTPGEPLCRVSVSATY